MTKRATEQQRELAARPAHRMGLSQLVLAQVQSMRSAEVMQEFFQTVRDRCFTVCVTKPSSSLSSSEQQCLARCCDRYAEVRSLRWRLLQVICPATEPCLCRLRRLSHAQSCSSPGCNNRRAAGALRNTARSCYLLCECSLIECAQAGKPKAVRALTGLATACWQRRHNSGYSGKCLGTVAGLSAAVYTRQ